MLPPPEPAVDAAGPALDSPLDADAPAVTVELRPHIRMRMAEEALSASAGEPDVAVTG